MRCPSCGDDTGIKFVDFIPLTSTIAAISNANNALFIGESEEYEDTTIGVFVQCVSCQYTEVTVDYKHVVNFDSFLMDEN